MKKGQLTRQIILDKAFELACNHGIDEITYNGVAKAIGIAPQSMYRYIENIEDLKTSIIFQYIHELLLNIEQKTEGYSRIESLSQGIQALISFKVSNLSFADLFRDILKYKDNPSINEALENLRQAHFILLESFSPKIKLDEQLKEVLTKFLIGHFVVSITHNEPEDKLKKTFEENLKYILDGKVTN